MAEAQEPATENAAPADQEADQDVRSRFKEALARKNAKANEGEKHLGGNNKIHDAHNRAGGKRQFRRKSG